MGATRFITNVTSDATTISFDVVVRDEMNARTYGGGRVTLTKPIDPALRIPVEFSQAELAVEVGKAVEAIIKDGNDAYPRGKVDVAEPADEDARKERDSYARRLRSIVMGENIADRPTRLDAFGSR